MIYGISHTMKTPSIRSRMNTIQAPAASRRALALLLLLAALLAGPRTVNAQPTAAQSPPATMSYQGFLVDSTGLGLGPNTPANYVVQFRIFTTAKHGS